MRKLTLAVLLPAVTGSVWAQLVISGNENKIDLSSGTPQVVQQAESDTISLLDFSVFPPRIQHIETVPNTVIGPPSNIAIAPGGSVALVASSVRIDPDQPDQFVPDTLIQVLDLKAHPPAVTAKLRVGLQPSGISITPDGRHALVANRAGGTVSVLRLKGQSVELADTVPVCEPDLSLSDVAISPDGRLALASVQKGGYLSVLKLSDGHVTTTGRKLSVYGQPYRCVITPDGELGLTAGQGAGNGLDSDAMTVIDLAVDPPVTIDYVAVGVVPESIEVNPKGDLVAAVVMNGSNLAADDPRYHPHGAAVLLVRRGRTFEKVQEMPVGRIPEGVAFTPDGRYLIVQCHPDRELWVFSVENSRLKDTGVKIPVPGMPSSLRAAP